MKTFLLAFFSFFLFPGTNALAESRSGLAYFDVDTNQGFVFCKVNYDLVKYSCDKDLSSQEISSIQCGYSKCSTKESSVPFHYFVSALPYALSGKYPALNNNFDDVLSGNLDKLQLIVNELETDPNSENLLKEYKRQLNALIEIQSVQNQIVNGNPKTELYFGHKEPSRPLSLSFLALKRVPKLLETEKLVKENSLSCQYLCESRTLVGICKSTERVGYTIEDSYGFLEDRFEWRSSFTNDENVARERARSDCNFKRYVKTWEFSGLASANCRSYDTITEYAHYAFDQIECKRAVLFDEIRRVSLALYRQE